MAILKPTPSEINLTDFKDGSYTFLIESVIDSGRGFGLLTIKVTDGYMLKSPLSDTLKREQSLGHVLQSDGSRVARGTVTLISEEEPKKSGTVTIRNPLGEIVQLTIQVSLKETTANRSESSLLIKDSVLQFPRTAPGQTRILRTTLNQQGNGSPVTITSSSPQKFLVAANGSAFSPVITITPSPVGSQLAVQYTPAEEGDHQANLTVQAGSETQLIALNGQSKTRQSVGKWFAMAAFLLVLGALYWYRCLLFPGLCAPDTNPLLTVNPVSLDFDTVQIGQERVLTLMIGQQNATTPIHLSSGDVDRFTVSATGSIYSDTLSITPLAAGSQLWVRYKPRAPGRHLTQLTVQAVYGFRTIPLVGVGVRPPAQLMPLPTPPRALPVPPVSRRPERATPPRLPRQRQPANPTSENEMEKLLKEQKQ